MPARRIADHRIHYEKRGDGEPLLLLHGLGSSAMDWEEQIPAFAASYQVIAPDLVGFGRSDKIRNGYSIAKYSDDMFALLDQLGIERFHVLGYSMGGAIAFQMAVDQPKRIASMIILNSLPSFALDTLAKRMEYRLRCWVVRFFGMKPLSRLMKMRLFPKEKHRQAGDRMAARYALNDRKSYLAALKAIAGWSIVDRLGTLDMPVLLISADNDYTPVAEKSKYLAQMPNARLVVINDSRHITPVDQAGALNKTVLDFLHQVIAGDDRPSNRQ